MIRYSGLLFGPSPCMLIKFVMCESDG